MASKKEKESTFSLRLPPELKAKLRAYAAIMGKTENAVIREAAKSMLEEANPEKLQEAVQTYLANAEQTARIVRGEEE